MKTDNEKRLASERRIGWTKRLLLCLMFPCFGVFADWTDPWSGHVHWEYTGPWKWTVSNLKTETTLNGFKQTCDAIITGYTGNDTEITIPEKITMSTYTSGDGPSICIEYEATVKGIGDKAFYDRSGLTSVTIPNSVTNIGDYAFYGCSGLTSVTIPNSVTSIGYCAFRGCSGLTSVIIPNSVTNLGLGVFCDCSGLTSVVIPNSITSIVATFGHCSSLTSVTIPNSVTNLDGTFPGCSGLTSIVIPNSVTSIGGGTFNGCSGLTNVVIPDSVTNIEDYAFYECSGLTNVTIGNGVTSIGYSAFDGCTHIKDITVPQCAIDYGDEGSSSRGVSRLFGSSRTSIKNVSFSSVITNIGAYTFYNCSGLTSVTIPNSVTSIGDSAFYGCSGLTSVVIPNSVTSIANYTFCNCSGLVNVTIPDGVTSLGREAFSGCSNLTSISIPESVTYFGASCFEGCPVYTLPLYRMVLGIGGSSGGSPGSSSPSGETVIDPRYTLTSAPADRSIVTATVDDDCAIDNFVLTDGKVYDTALRIVNTSENAVRLTLPTGYTYECFKGMSPLTIPAKSTNMLTVTRTADNVFLVTREELETVK